MRTLRSYLLKVLVPLACNLACSDRPEGASAPVIESMVRPLVTKDTSLKSPQDWSTGYTQWWHPENVVAVGAGASMGNGGVKQTWSKFQFGLPPGATINSVLLKTASGSGGFDSSCIPYILTANLRTATQVSAGVEHDITSMLDNRDFDFSFTGLTGWTAAMVNGDDFGVDLTSSCKCSISLARASVDYLAMSVNYTTHCLGGTSTDPNDPAACIDCAPGTYNADIDGTCQPCAAGTFASQAKTIACTPCPAGSHNASTGASACEVCPAGTFASQADAPACTPCPAGQYSASPGSSACQACPAGKRVNATGTGCVCLPGTIGSPDGSCTPCPLGTATDATGTSCVACGPGEHSVGGRECQLCQVGMRGNTPPDDQCVGCPAGQHSTPARTSCVACDSGWIAVASDTCTKCVAGSFADEGIVCSLCIHGKYSNTDEATSCLSCPAGTKGAGVSLQTGNTRCDPCTGIQVSMSPVDDYCTFCDAGTAPNADHSACVACSGNQVAGPGQASCTDCPADTTTTDHIHCLFLGPQVDSIAPAKGSKFGGTVITITGQHFIYGDEVTVGGVSATGIVVQNSTSISAITPARPVGPALVQITHPAEPNVLDSERASSSTASSNNTFTYDDDPTSLSVSGIVPSFGLNTGGTLVTITGTGFRPGATTVSFGGTAATGVTVTSSVQMTAITPAHVTGGVRVTVSTGTDTAASPALFIYETNDPNPVVMWSVNPSVGSTAGGTQVTVTGANFDNDVIVNFADTPGTITARASGSLTVLTPAHAAGSVDVTVINPGRLQSFSQVGAFTYSSTAIGNPDAGVAPSEKDAAPFIVGEAPVITAIYAETPSSTGSINLIIEGANFSPAALVRAYGREMTVLSRSPNRIVFVLPPDLPETFGVGVINPEDGKFADALYSRHAPDGGASLRSDGGTVNPRFDGGGVVRIPLPDAARLGDAPSVATVPEVNESASAADAALLVRDAAQTDQGRANGAEAGSDSASDLRNSTPAVDAGTDQGLAEKSGAGGSCSCRVGDGRPSGTSLWFLAVALMAIAKASAGRTLRKRRK